MLPAEVHRVAVAAGLDSEQAVIATAIAWGESELNPDAVGDVGLQDETWGPSMGLWQVRSLKAQRGTGKTRDADRLLDPAFNAQAMVLISNYGKNWNPWTIWRNGAFQQYLDDVREAIGGRQMKLVTRAEWGARPARGRTALSVNVVTAHWGGDSPGALVHDECAAWLRSWQAMHMDTHGWTDLAYNLAVCQHGYVFEGRGKGARSAANGTNEGNGSSYAIVYIGGTPAPFTEEAKVAFNQAADYLGASLDWGHRDWLSTACPGDEIYEWVHAGHPAEEAQEEENELTQEQADTLTYISQIMTELKVQLCDAAGTDNWHEVGKKLKEKLDKIK